MRIDYKYLIFPLGSVSFTVGSGIRGNSGRCRDGQSGEVDSRSGKTRMSVSLLASLQCQI